MKTHSFHPSDNIRGRLISVSQPAPATPLIDFLRRAHGEKRVHWENEREMVAFAGFGAAVELRAEGTTRFQDLQQMARALFDDAVLRDQPEARPRLFGGFSFRSDFQPQAVWDGFYAAQFILPRVLLTRHGDQHWLTLTDFVHQDSNLTHEQARLQAELDTLHDELFWNTDVTLWNPEWEEASGIEYPMTHDEWDRMISNATTRMQNGPLNKVVLSRMCQIRFSNHVNVLRALSYLRGSYAACYRFLFEPQPHNTFYGASPELLVGVRGRDVRADALAGSVRRGDTPADDARFVQQILSDPKERQEHGFVVDGLRDKLARFTSGLHAEDTPGVLKLSNIQHLHTPVQGTLNDDYGVLRLVELLHPTPALGGSPYQMAQDVIKELEPMPRGWYAAPVGWIDSDLNGDFAVGIRSAVAREGRVWAYSGAGIVAESVPQREWAETDLKFRPMLNAVGVAHERA